MIKGGSPGSVLSACVPHQCHCLVVLNAATGPMDLFTPYSRAAIKSMLIERTLALKLPPR